MRQYMTNKKLESLSNFLSDMSYENIQSLKEELEEQGINTFQCKNAIMQQIAKAKADLKVARGTELYNKFLKQLKSFRPNNSLFSNSEVKLQAAFRKLEKELTPDELEELINDSAKLDILEKLIEEEQ